MIHLMPVDEDHDTEPSCWCQPTLEDLERDDGSTRPVWRHRDAAEVDRVAAVRGPHPGAP